MTTLVDCQGQRITFNYKGNTELEPDVQEALSKFDLTGDGKVTAAELTAGANAMEQLKTQGAFLKKIVGALLIVVCVLLVGTFGLTVLAIDMSKETKIEGKALQTVGGEDVTVASSEMTVADGKLVARSPDRRLDAGGPLQTATAAVSVNSLAEQTGSDRRLTECSDQDGNYICFTADKSEMEGVINAYLDSGISDCRVSLYSGTMQISAFVEWAVRGGDAIQASGFTVGFNNEWVLLGCAQDTCEIICQTCLRQGGLGGAMQRRLHARALQDAPRGSPRQLMKNCMS